MIRTWMIGLAALGFAMAGCGKKDEPKEEAAEALSKAEQFFVKSIKEDLKAAQAEVAKGEDAGLKCVAAGSYAEKLRAKKVPEVEALLKELDQLCQHDAPLAAAEKAVAAAEAARKASTDAVLSECYSAELDRAIKTLDKKFADDAKVKAIKDRFAAACPKK